MIARAEFFSLVTEELLGSEYLTFCYFCFSLPNFTVWTPGGNV